jgi:hypothetical protein
MNAMFQNNLIKKSIKKFILITAFLNHFLFSFSQVLSENEIKQLAQKVNTEMKGFDSGTGIIGRGCYALGRTLVYQYEVDEGWNPVGNLKADLILNFKEAGYAEAFFNNKVNAEFHYYYGTRLRKKIAITSSEFSEVSLALGDFLSIKGHPKSKGVDLQLKKPVGWEIQEGDRPNIIKKFIYKNSTYTILVKDNYGFVSRKQAKELLDEGFADEIISEFKSAMKNVKVLNQNVVSVDKYPTLQITLTGEMERMGLTLQMTMKSWIILYEDKVVFLQGGGLTNEFSSVEPVFNLITNSVIFPEQYTY